MEKAIRYFNSIMGAFIGVFIGRTVLIIRSYVRNPERFAAYSAPWYTEIVMHAGHTLIALSVCVIIRIVLKRVCRNKEKQPE